MPWNGSGTFNRKHNWTQEAATNTPILATNFDDDTNDITSVGLGNCITRDGQGGPTANIPWNNFKITGLANPTLPQDAVPLLFMQNAITQATFNTALPSQPGNTGKFVTTDGTNASWSDTFGVAINEKLGTAIPSAATVNLTTATGNLVHITGTTTITAITIPSGAERTVVFDGVLTLTNGVNLILPTGANITTAAGDSMKVRGDGSAARVVSYTTATGRALAVTNPGLVLVAGPFTPTAAANIDFLTAFSAAYDDYKIVFEGINPGSNVNDTINMRLAVAGSADTGSNYLFVNANNSSSTAATSWVLNGGFSVSGNRGANFEIIVTNVNTTSATQMKGGVILGSDLTGSPLAVSAQIKGAAYINTAAVTGFRLFLSGGTSFAAQGIVKVYGISKV